MSFHIKAIETHYKGYRFRSRLEARWAVFFNTLGIPWEYEPDGFVFNGIRYLPDFRIEIKISDDLGHEKKNLPNSEVHTVYAEVKPSNLNMYDRNVWTRLECVALGTQKKTILLHGMPDIVPYSGVLPFGTNSRFMGVFLDWCPGDKGPSLSLLGRYSFSMLSLSGDGRFIPKLDWDERAKRKSAGDKAYAAVVKARSARFEYGECP